MARGCQPGTIWCKGQTGYPFAVPAQLPKQFATFGVPHSHGFPAAASKELAVVAESQADRVRTAVLRRGQLPACHYIPQPYSALFTIDGGKPDIRIKGKASDPSS